MTKPITSVAVMMLVEEGRVLLNHPVARYLPEFSDPKVLERVGDDGGFRLVEPKRPMTVRHLLTHTSGLTYGEGNGDEVLASYYRVASIAGSFGGSESLSTAVGRIGRLPLLFHPGESWAYGFSTDVLGRLVEVVSGVDLAEFFQTRIFDPLGMHDTHFYLPPVKVGRLARVYTRTGSGDLEWFPAEYPYDGPSAFLSGGAGLTSSILDYARFLQMMSQRGTLNGERIVGPRTVDLMTGNHIGEGITTHGPGYGFGLGFDVHADPGLSGSPKGVGSYAWGGYWHTGFWVDPGAELFVIMMAQLIPSDHVDTGEKLPHLVYQALFD
jgi:CubicO group peptidase (beta-lactamase class C family)